MLNVPFYFFSGGGDGPEDFVGCFEIAFSLNWLKDSKKFIKKKICFLNCF
jgi:hypothetical protein